MKKERLSTLIVTGYSGAGKTVVLNAFEDSGFFCVDNLPVSLIKTFVSLCSKTTSITKIAIGVDIRERKFLSGLSETVSDLKKDHNVEIIFLEASQEALIRRFKETRRPHPLGYKDLKTALKREANLLVNIRKDANRIVDTSSLTPHQLRRFITDSLLSKGPREMIVNLVSFGYKYGIPHEADLLFDVRFLPNPYFIKELKPLTGTSQKVKRFVLSSEETQEFLKRITDLLNYLIPFYVQEGRSYLTIGIGCTGGRHRSPVLIEDLSKKLRKLKIKISVAHKDL